MFSHLICTKTRLITALVATLMVAAILVTSSAAEASTGTFWHVQATCEFGRITVTSPQMSPVGNIAIGSDGSLAPASQWVAFRALVARWNSSTRQWVFVASSDWMQNVATEISGTSNTWLNSRTGQWEWGARTFRISTPGYYTVWAQYHWYPFYQDSGGTTRILQTPFLADYMNGSYMGTGDPYCHYR